MVKVGLEVLASNPRDWVPWGARVGLISGSGSTKSDYRSAREVVRGLVGHGAVRVLPRPTVPADDAGDPGASPIPTLVGPLWDPWVDLTGRDLEGLELLLLDLQDVGCGWYGALPILWDALRAAAVAGVKLLVLDRPNPLGGMRIAGPRVSPSLPDAGGMRLPVVHGLTLGEMALWLASRLASRPELEIVPMKGWKRQMQWPATGRSWVMPSPSFPAFEVCATYPGTALFDCANLSTGRGTTKPYELVGAPWVNGEDLSRRLHASGLRGGVFRSVTFRPSVGMHAGQVCQGVQIHILDPEVYPGLAIGLTLLRELAVSAAAALVFMEFAPDPENDSAAVKAFVESESVRSWAAGQDNVSALEALWVDDHRSWREEREPFLLYREGPSRRPAVTGELVYGPRPHVTPVPPGRWTRHTPT